VLNWAHVLASAISLSLSRSLSLSLSISLYLSLSLSLSLSVSLSLSQQQPNIRGWAIATHLQPAPWRLVVLRVLLSHEAQADDQAAVLMLRLARATYGMECYLV
jgi:hypothetical protein